jgi:uncharacterized glyoxalase superfamily protein PhnB
MTSIANITIGVADTAAAERFYANAFGLGDLVRVRTSHEETSGFRGFTMSLIVAKPADVDLLYTRALDAGATSLKSATKSMWGYGGVLSAPDGTIWKIATSSKKDTGPATGHVDSVVLLLGVANVPASKQFYVEQGLTVAKSFGRMYVDFASGGSKIQLGLYRRRALAKDAGVSPDGTGSHRIAVGTATGPFTDPDGFTWETTSQPAMP